MLPILITILVTAPILAIGTWLYLRRRKLSPRVRIALMSLLFLFVLIAGPAIFVMGRGGRLALGQVPLLWLLGVLGVGVQLFRLCRNKGAL